jgi:hypothetical protein
VALQQQVERARDAEGAEDDEKSEVNLAFSPSTGENCLFNTNEEHCG